MIQSFLVAFIACVIGKICGMGGGVIIKPVLDALEAADRSSINFMSSCTVLGMSAYSVGKSMIHQSSAVDVKNTTPLAIGAAVGGIIGNNLFKMVAAAMKNPNLATGIQAVTLLILTLVTFVYTLRKNMIKSYRITKFSVIILAGLALGIIGSFLGIGGGPFNMAVLFLLFSMSTKTAASNSLYVIFFSQLLSLIWSAITHSIPDVQMPFLLGMMLFGIMGSEIGGKISNSIDDKHVTVLFEGAMVLVMLINVYNIIHCFR